MNQESIEDHELIDNCGILYEDLPACVRSEYVCTHRHVPTRAVQSTNSPRL